MAFRIPKRAPSTCCGGRIQMRLRRGDELYRGRVDLKEKLFWLCEGCGGWVGCHPGTDRALGVPASPELRRARSLAHAVFDRLWRNGTMTRGEAYGWLASTLRLTPEQTHMGQMDLATCRRVVNAVADHSKKPRPEREQWGIEHGTDWMTGFPLEGDHIGGGICVKDEPRTRRATLDRDGHLGLELDDPDGGEQAAYHALVRMGMTSGGFGDADLDDLLADQPRDFGDL